MVQVLPLLPVQGEIFGDVIVCCQQKAARAAGWIANTLPRRRAHYIHNRLDERPRGEVLPRSRFGILGVLFQQALVNLALHVNVQPDPGFAVNQLNQALQLGGVLNAVLRLAEDDRDQPRALPQFGEDMPVMRFQFIAGAVAQACPVAIGGDGAGLAQFVNVFGVHFEEQQVSELLHIVAVGHAVVPQDVAVVPDTLDNGGGFVCHDYLTLIFENHPGSPGRSVCAEFPENRDNPFSPSLQAGHASTSSVGGRLVKTERHRWGNILMGRYR